MNANLRRIEARLAKLEARRPGRVLVIDGPATDEGISNAVAQLVVRLRRPVRDSDMLIYVRRFSDTPLH